LIQSTNLSDTILHIPRKPWRKKNFPKRVLAIRLQAMGDLVITLPYLQNLKKTLPENSRLDLLTRKEVDSIPKNIYLFDHVYSIGGGRNGKKQLASAFLLLPRLLMQQYDVVIDLQNNRLSKMVRKTLMPKAWSEFDRFSPIPAGECNRLAIEAIGIGKCFANSGFKLMTPEIEIKNLLLQNGWDGISNLIVLNPAGAFVTRNWPMEYYVEFARLWLKKFPATQFVLTGVNFISSKADYLKQMLGDKIVNLISKTTPVQAFALVQNIQLILSEDSGLMHMAWVSGIPTLALFGSTRSDRATPLGKHSLLLHSSDLACGNCMLEKCIYGDNHCITRYSPQFVFEKAVSLLVSSEKETSSCL
jgi:heptosyltransferase-2